MKLVPETKMGVTKMALSSHTSRPTDLGGSTNDETPLLSETGREFLDGKVKADVYVDRARIVAADRARRDLYRVVLRERRQPRRIIALIGLSAATISYAVLGLTTLGSDSDTLTVATFVTACVCLLITIGYGRHRDDDDEGDESTRGFGNIIHILVYSSRILTGISHDKD